MNRANRRAASNGHGPTLVPSDPVEQAVAAADAPPKTLMKAGTIRLSTGRPIQIVFPADINDLEIVDMIGQIVTVIRTAGRQQAPMAAGRLILPRT